MKLEKITFKNTPRLPGVSAGAMTTIDTEKPVGQMRGWRLVVRGAAVFLISPPGWEGGKTHLQWDRKGASVICEIPRSDVYFHWKGHRDALDAYAKSNRFESEPFGVPFEYPEESAAPAGAPPGGFLSGLDPSQVGDP